MSAPQTQNGEILRFDFIQVAITQNSIKNEAFETW